MAANDLMKKIQMYDFCLNELNLYLDTHPNSQKGLEMFHKYNKLLSEACDEYTMMYGPITINDVSSKCKWTWATEKWPWEKGE